VLEISGKHVLVTGASSGLGRHFAKMLARKGAKVTLAARRIDALTSAVEEIKQAGGVAQSVRIDVTASSSIDKALEDAQVGFGPIHGVVNNAGVTATKPALEQDERAWDSVIDTNLKGVWLVANAVARQAQVGILLFGGKTMKNPFAVLFARIGLLLGIRSSIAAS
jgi:NAD(P)-dependent dehydrogenase (short-subunit alcohol dehydrogenase family)